MDHLSILIPIGFLIGVFGTLIGAGGGFILVPVLILCCPELNPEIITAISIVIVAANAISGSIAYGRSGRIDFKAGLVFALFTIPGSILGVLTTKYVPKHFFYSVFGIILIMLCIFLLVKPDSKPVRPESYPNLNRWKHHSLTDREGNIFSYSYNQTTGIIISILVGFLSPLLGIGGGIIHVPALINLLNFPVYVATATSHFILAVMSTVSVIVNAIRGSYNDPKVLHMIIGLVIGVVPGAQVGAWLSHKIKTQLIIKTLAICLGVVGLRILLSH